MMKLVFISLFISSFTAFASMPEVDVSCELIERTEAGNSKRKVLAVTQLSDGSASYAVKPDLAVDSEAIYTINLSAGPDYTDATGDIIGTDYFLSLVRIQDSSRSLKAPKIKGKTQDIVYITERESSDHEISYVNKRGKVIYKAPKNISLKYKLGRNQNIKLKCDIISIR